jgi:hypothetical protein
VGIVFSGPSILTGVCECVIIRVDNDSQHFEFAQYPMAHNRLKTVSEHW